MKLSKLAAVGLAVLLLTAGAATALPGEAPAFAGDDAQADDNRQDDDNRPEHAGNASEEAPDVADGDERAADAETRGPPAELPDPVPEHVSGIHDLVRAHLDGALDGDLGQAIADVTPDEGAADS